MGQNLAYYSQWPGGNKSSLNITAAGLISAKPCIAYRLLVLNGGITSGNLVLADTNAYVTGQTITGITQAANAVVTISTGGSTNPFAVGNVVTFASVVGMTQINGLQGTVTAIGGVTTAWTITTSINSTAFTAWSSGGTIASFGAVNQFLSLPFATVPGAYGLEWPCLNGLAVVGVPGAGTPIYSLAYY